MARQEGAGGGTLPARLTWVGATVICGAVAGLLLFLAAINSSAGLLAGAAGLGVVFLVLLPGLMLRPRWWWWLLNVVAVAAALFAAALVFNATCGSSCGDPAAEVNPLILIPSFTGLGALLVGIQGLGLKGWRARLIRLAAGAGPARCVLDLARAARRRLAERRRYRPPGSMPAGRAGASERGGAGVCLRPQGDRAQGRRHGDRTARHARRW